MFSSCCFFFFSCNSTTRILSIILFSFHFSPVRFFFFSVTYHPLSRSSLLPNFVKADKILFLTWMKSYPADVPWEAFVKDIHIHIYTDPFILPFLYILLYKKRFWYYLFNIFHKYKKEEIIIISIRTYSSCYSSPSSFPFVVIHTYIATVAVICKILNNVNLG